MVFPNAYDQMFLIMRWLITFAWQSGMQKLCGGAQRTRELHPFTILLFQVPGFQPLIIKALILTLEAQHSCEHSKCYISWQFAMSFFIIKYLAEKFYVRIFENIQRYILHVLTMMCKNEQTLINLSLEK